MNETLSNRAPRTPRAGLLLPSLGTLALLLAGCAVGPDDQRPLVSTPAHFRNAPADASTNALADLPWWEFYRDETLVTLIREALTNNHDLALP